jgi:predicted Co/Zn/Cd cation transporter (cation efflux family)
MKVRSLVQGKLAMGNSSEDSFNVEMRALRVSMYAAFVMALVGVGFAYAANSQAILLDGLFNFLLFFMVAIGISMSRKINQGPDQQYHFGYGGYEPFMVLARAGAGIVLMGYSTLVAIQTMLRGGSEVKGGMALIYSIVLAIACGAVATYMYWAYKKTGWPTMYSEFITWMLNGVISSTAGVALFAAGFLKGTSLAWLVPYADSIVVLAMQIVLLPAPLQLLVISFQELAGRAPQEKLESQAALEAVIPQGFEVRTARAIRQGRSEFISLDISAAPQSTVEQCDEIRRRWRKLSKEKYPNTYAGLIFTNLTSEM